MNAYTQLAKEFKKRDNKVGLGPIIGKVLNSLPDLKISILSGQVVLNRSQLYITKSLYEDTIDVMLSGDLNIDNVSQIVEGDISLGVDPLSEGDKVLMIPSNSGQEFFIIDIVRKV